MSAAKHHLPSIQRHIPMRVWGRQVGCDVRSYCGRVGASYIYVELSNWRIYNALLRMLKDWKIMENGKHNVSGSSDVNSYLLTSWRTCDLILQVAVVCKKRFWFVRGPTYNLENLLHISNGQSDKYLFCRMGNVHGFLSLKKKKIMQWDSWVLIERNGMFNKR